MSTFRALARSVEDLPVPSLDVDDLVTRGRKRRTHRRVASVVATVAVVALAVTGGVLAGGVHQQSSGPVDQPQEQRPHRTDRDKGSPAAVRPMVYGVGRPDNNPVRYAPAGVGRLNIGTHQVVIDQVLDFVRAWSVVVTDAGAVYVQHDHSVWFTDGGPPRRLAQHACAGSSGDYRNLGSGNASPLVAWVDCAPESEGDLVVYDTTRGQEAARYRVPACRAKRLGGFEVGCTPEAFVGEHLYVGGINRRGWLVEHQLRIDLSSGAVSPAGSRMFAEDLRTHPPSPRRGHLLAGGHAHRHRDLPRARLAARSRRSGRE